MDPNECLQTLLDAWSDTEIDVAQEHADALRAWLCKGGYVPVLTKETLIRVVDMLMAAL